MVEARERDAGAGHARHDHDRRGRMMPYKSLADIPNSLKGLKPPITLAQANMIAEWIDAMLGNLPDKRPDNPYATGISQFKRLYSVRDGKWVQKQ